jgi:hypothetical protein
VTPLESVVVRLRSSLARRSVAELLVAALLVVDLRLLTLKIRLSSPSCSPRITCKASSDQMHSLVQDFQIEAAPSDA